MLYSTKGAMMTRISTMGSPSPITMPAPNSTTPTTAASTPSALAAGSIAMFETPPHAGQINSPCVRSVHATMGFTFLPQ